MVSSCKTVFGYWYTNFLFQKKICIDRSFASEVYFTLDTSILLSTYYNFNPLTKPQNDYRNLVLLIMAYVLMPRTPVSHIITEIGVCKVATFMKKLIIQCVHFVTIKDINSSHFHNIRSLSKIWRRELHMLITSVLQSPTLTRLNYTVLIGIIIQVTKNILYEKVGGI